MDNEPVSEDWLTPEEREEHNAAVYAYMKQHVPYLFKPGIAFSPEQEAKLKSLVEQGKIVEAQKIILDKLSQQDDIL